jgi:hypothetical protein
MDNINSGKTNYELIFHLAARTARARLRRRRRRRGGRRSGTASAIEQAEVDRAIALHAEVRRQPRRLQHGRRVAAHQHGLIRTRKNMRYQLEQKGLSQPTWIIQSSHLKPANIPCWSRRSDDCQVRNHACYPESCPNRWQPEQLINQRSPL